GLVPDRDVHPRAGKRGGHDRNADDQKHPGISIQGFTSTLATSVRISETAVSVIVSNVPPTKRAIGPRYVNAWSSFTVTFFAVKAAPELSGNTVSMLTVVRGVPATPPAATYLATRSLTSASE